MNRALFIASNFNLKYAKVEHLLLALTKDVDVNYVLSRCIAFLIIVRTGHRKAESTARRKDSNRGMFFLALFFIANQ
ncbi:hypothetical protein OZD66_00890 [Wolbachia endosymbiont of Drosophila baimaii]|uniref:hypothetical protein n=1 Tax=Wolbachia endosymbiont of Drosophila baimaii TaxID=375917 RepID=UPI0023A9C126|nr:hypothetical protein [Wolbachia endosymbiont of Drosophila baimaii]MDE5058429.1 hypothetical protein [Wolbachia endosymbiont of Drosophila baimaii]